MSTHVATTFYSSFAGKDSEAMAACYDDSVTFEDPAFGELQGENARDMWRMLVGSGSDMSLEYKVLSASDTAATVNWIASYTFSTGRPVVNDVTATMQIRDGLIVDHRDVFDFWTWSRQALGVPGLLLGWSSPMKKKVRATAKGRLEDFQAGRS